MPCYFADGAGNVPSFSGSCPRFTLHGAGSPTLHYLSLLVWYAGLSGVYAGTEASRQKGGTCLVAIKLEVAKADLIFEAGFSQPEFNFFRDDGVLMHHLFKRLEPHGLRLNDIQVQRSTANVGEPQIVCYLFNYWMTVRIRIERIEVVCSVLPRDHVEKFKAAILDVLQAVKDYRPEQSFRAFAMALGLHAKLEGQPVREYLAQFVTKVPQNLGPSTGAGASFYFGPEGDRLLASITADVSAVVQDAIYLRIHGLWDAKRVAPASLSGVADAFVQQALEGLDLSLSA